jgi:hypothetical protein
MVNVGRVLRGRFLLFTLARNLAKPKSHMELPRAFSRKGRKLPQKNAAVLPLDIGHAHLVATRYARDKPQAKASWGWGGRATGRSRSEPNALRPSSLGLWGGPGRRYCHVWAVGELHVCHGEEGSG